MSAVRCACKRVHRNATRTLARLFWQPLGEDEYVQMGTCACGSTIAAGAPVVIVETCLCRSCHEPIQGAKVVVPYAIGPLGVFCGRCAATLYGVDDFIDGWRERLIEFAEGGEITWRDTMPPMLVDEDALESSAVLP